MDMVAQDLTQGSLQQMGRGVVAADGHPVDVFLLESIPCRKIIGNIDWHKGISL